jgi:dihydroorotate dehydrogenase electron transfer subunit
MPQLEVPVLARVALRPTWIHLTLDTSGLVRRPAAGQFFMVRCEGVYLRRPIFPCHVEAARMAILLTLGQDLGLTWLAARQVGEAVDLIGPLGHGFVLDPPPGNLLLVSWGPGWSSLLALAEAALAGGWEVTWLAALARPSMVDPGALLPPEVEYQVALGPSALAELELLCRQALPWADRICAVGGEILYTRLAVVIQEVRLSLRPGLAQVLMEMPMACGVGACGACTIATNRGVRQVCYHGPVFDLAGWAR